MKESLKILLDGKGCNSALDKGNTDSDNFVFEKAKRIKDLKKKQEFLLQYVSSSPDQYKLCCIYYIDLIKKSNPSYAYDLAYKLHKHLVKEPLPHWMIAEIALENKAWIFARKELQTALWLSLDDKQNIKNTEILLKKVLTKIKSGESDSSNTSYWKNKEIDIIEIFFSMLHSLDGSELLKYGIGLLKTFPENTENLEKVYESLALKNDSGMLLQFKDYLKESSIPDSLKNLYFGLINYDLSNYTESLDFLSKAKEAKSNYVKAMFYISANHLLMHNIPDFTTIFYKLIEPYSSNMSLGGISMSSSPSFTAILILWSIYSETSLTKKWEFQNEKIISKELSRLIKRVIGKWTNEQLNDLTKKLIQNDFLRLLPSFSIYLCEAFIQAKLLPLAKEILNSITDSEIYRLKAWIYRVENNTEMAEKELSKYRASIDFSKTPNIVLESLSINYPKELGHNEEDILNSIKDIYKQTDGLVKELQLEYGINNNTCEENSCADCCKKTFPIITYSEYLYIKKWLENQPKSYQDEIKLKSLEIVNRYMKTYKSEPPFITNEISYINTKVTEYPKEFTCTCPFLKDDKCTVYESRPFMCRAYGYSTIDGASFKGCNYFFFQLMYATKTTNTRKIINFDSFNQFIKEADNKLIETSTSAPIPLWFAYDHRESKTKAKYNFLGNGAFSLVYKLIINMFFKKQKRS